MVVANFLLQIVILMIVVALFLVVIGYLKRAQQLLEVVKGWATVGRNQHEDARRVLGAVERAANESQDAVHVTTSKADEVKAAVADVPAKVVEEIRKSTDPASGILGGPT